MCVINKTGALTDDEKNTKPIRATARNTARHFEQVIFWLEFVRSKDFFKNSIKLYRFRRISCAESAHIRTELNHLFPNFSEFIGQDFIINFIEIACTIVYTVSRSEIHEPTNYITRIRIIFIARRWLGLRHIWYSLFDHCISWVL